jgi:cobyrinic acid a,c-diamide synthase
VVALPRLVISAPSTGQGKTTIATGLMAALTSAGHVVSGHKVGPDYIDPGYHALACGRPGRNLDPHLVGADRITPLLLHGARGADLAVIEGVMGLHDGRIGGDGFSSTAHVARLTRTPVVLVVDISRISRSAGAIVHGIASYDPSVEVVGVILNKAGSARNIAEVTAAIRLPVLGVIGRDPGLETPSRHLGLVPVAERDASAAAIGRLGDVVARDVDLAAVIELAHSAPDLDDEPWDPQVELRAPSGARPVIAVAGGRAFTFRYAETEELLQAAGCAVVPFDPISDQNLPTGTQGLYLGGGFPEVYAAELAANRSLLADIRTAVAAGVPTVAECAGLLYLADTLDEVPMAAALPVMAAMSPHLTLRYPCAIAESDSVITVVGESVTGHEFHRTDVRPAAGSAPAWSINGVPVGFSSATLHASYLHVHWAGHPQLAQRFADAVHNAAPHQPVSPTYLTEPIETPVLSDPLVHHGDQEVAAGLLDFAVNVFPGERPDWLDEALLASLSAASTYPDPAAATAAIAARHQTSITGVLATAGAAEAFSLVAQLRAWHHPVVIDPQFTEPHVALQRAGTEATSVRCLHQDGFALDPSQVPTSADLVIIGNPTNPTGRLHSADAIRELLKPGRLVVVDEAFMDAIPGEVESLSCDHREGLVVIRSLTKHWSIPGIRAGYVVGDPEVIAGLAARQVPWSVSAPAIAAMTACSTPRAIAEGLRRAEQLRGWREHLERGLAERDLDYLPSAASFVLAKLGARMHPMLRQHGIAVRRADTFPGLDRTWVRIAVRPHATTERLLAALDRINR